MTDEELNPTTRIVYLEAERDALKAENEKLEREWQQWVDVGTELTATCEKLRAALENIAVYGCGMLSMPAAVNHEETWLKMRVAEYESVARRALEKDDERSRLLKAYARDYGGRELSEQHGAMMRESIQYMKERDHYREALADAKVDIDLFAGLDDPKSQRRHVGESIARIDKALEGVI
jgi:hypothetical protein